ncbi:MAG: PAS domain S-box protein [Alphaproteobacteria bacterium]|jgi:PAS domain S-box-containing protein|nr:PAS domain S-box protein [Alphaproteobacteria bacterium]
MASVAFAVAGISIWLLYGTAFEEERARLAEAAQSQARLIEAVARFDAKYSRTDHPEGPAAATLGQIADAHEQYRGFGDTGEFTLAERRGDRIVFLLRHRHFDLDKPKPVPWRGEVAEPMRRALRGLSGTVVGPDYRGVTVLAAHEPVAVLNLGIVAKIDLAEIRAPFIRAAAISAAGGVLVFLLGALLFRQAMVPLLERERVEAELRQSEERFRTLFQNAPEALALLDPETERLVDANDNALALFGWPHEELLRRPFANLHPGHQPDGRESLVAAKERIDEALAGGAPVFEWTHINAEGVTVPCEIRLTRMELAGRQLICGSVLDISQRKAAELALRIRDQAMASSINGLAISDMNLTMVYVNDSFLRLWGYDDRREVVGKQGTMFGPDDETVLTIAREIEAQGSWIGEVPAKRRDGSLFEALLSASVIRNELGQPTHILGSFIDVSESKAAERALRESEQRFRDFAESSSDWFWESDADGRFTFVSSAIQAAVGVAAEWYIGKTTSEIVEKYYDSSDWRPYFEAFEARRPYRDMMLRRTGDDGGKQWVLGV